MSTPSPQSDEISAPVKIGTGSFAAIYAISGQSYVFKVLHNATQEETLLNEFNASTSFFAIPRALAYHNPTTGAITMFPDSPAIGLPRLPRVYIHSALFTSHATTNTAPAYLMDRVHRLPPHIAKIIRNKFYPKQAVEANTQAPAMCRLYFGEVIGVSIFVNSTHKFAMDVSRMNELRVELEAQKMAEVVSTVEEIASGMGEMLSKIHWLGGFDARDVEFVMAGSDVYIRFFVIDFNRMGCFVPDTGDIGALVDSFFANDPYYPRPIPNEPIYECFKVAYIKACPDRLRARAKMFTDAIESR